MFTSGVFMKLFSCLELERNSSKFSKTSADTFGLLTSIKHNKLGFIWIHRSKLVCVLQHLRGILQHSKQVWKVLFVDLFRTKISYIIPVTLHMSPWVFKLISLANVKLDIGDKGDCWQTFLLKQRIIANQMLQKMRPDTSHPANKWPGAASVKVDHAEFGWWHVLLK